MAAAGPMLQRPQQPPQLDKLSWEQEEERQRLLRLQRRQERQEQQQQEAEEETDEGDEAVEDDQDDEEAAGPLAEYEVLAREVLVLRTPSSKAEEVSRLKLGDLLRARPHLVHQRIWLQIARQDESDGAAEGWVRLKDSQRTALLQVASCVTVVVRGLPRCEEVSVSVPHCARTARVKTELRKKLGAALPAGAPRLARRVTSGLFQELSDNEPVSQEYHVLPKDFTTGPAQLQRELQEVARDPFLKCCQVKQLGPLDLSVVLAPSCGGVAKLRVKCPQDYPLQSCSVDVDSARSPMDEEGWCGIIGTGKLLVQGDPAWKVTHGLRKLLWGTIKLMETWPGFLFSSLIEAVKPFLDAKLKLVYISIGCGGPFLAQKLPRSVQRKHESLGGRCLLVLIDPFLTGATSPRNEWRVSQDARSSTVVCTCNALVEDWDLTGLEEFISRVSDVGVRRDSLVVGDHRGASFMCAPCPVMLHLAPSVQPMFTCTSTDENVCLDAGARHVLRAVHGITGEAQEEQELMEAMVHGGSCLSFGRHNLTARQLYLLNKVDRQGVHFRTEKPSELLLML